MSSFVRVKQRRRSVTPNATMTTLASPTLGGSSTMSLWQVEMDPGSCGPVHQFDAEQIWTVVDGMIEVSVGGEVTTLEEGDTMVLASGAVRQVMAPVASRVIVCGSAASAAYVPGEDASRGVPPWIA